jgi:hypothetical protein
MSDDRLLLVGLWADGEHLDTTACLGWIHPRHLQAPGWQADEKPRILAWLRGGAEWAGYMGQSRCRFAGCAAQGLGSTERTDGVWIWPEGLAHYVEEHDVRLPDAFLETMRAHDFTVPEDAGERRRQAIDGEPWLRWCAARHPIPPLPDAATLAEAQALAASLSLEGCQITITAAQDRWLISLQFPGPRVVDMLPPCPLDLLALHLHRWRRVPPDRQLSLADAAAILDEVIPPPSAWSRLRDRLSPGSGNLTRLDQDEEGFWRLRSGTAITALMPLDEAGWRFLLSRLKPGDPAIYAGINQQLHAAFREE